MRFMITYGKFILRKLSFDEAKDVLARPLALIEISHRLADQVATEEGGPIDTYQTNSDLVRNIEYQCQSSLGWILDHPDHHNSWRTACGAKGGAGLCKFHHSKNIERFITFLLRQGNRDFEPVNRIMGVCNERAANEDRLAARDPSLRPPWAWLRAAWVTFIARMKFGSGCFQMPPDVMPGNMPDN